MASRSSVSPEHVLSLLGELPYGIAIFQAESQDPLDLRLIYANTEAARQIGFDLGVLCGLTVREAFPACLGDGASGAAFMYQRVADGGPRERMSGVRYAADAQSGRWFDVLAIPLGDRKVAVLHDNLGERQHKEREVRELNLELERSLNAGERRYRSIFGAAPVGFWETDLSRVKALLDGELAAGHSPEPYLREHPELQADAARLWVVREVNAAARPLLDGRSMELPISFGEIVRGASENVWLALLCAVAEGAPSFDAELCVKGPGYERHLLMSMALPFEPADFAHVVVSMLDVTERKRLERDLWNAQRMDAIGQLTGGVAHDFNNLLMVISSYACFVQDQLPAGDPAREDVAIIREASDRAAALTNQLLAFGRRQVQQVEVLDLNAVVAGLENMLRRVTGAHIALGTDAAVDLGLVRADRVQIEQILMNLCVNAREAMPNGGTVTIATANVLVDNAESRKRSGAVPAGSYVRLSVTDDGEGMDEATRARIFEPFFTTKEQGRGTGLGLSTVHGMVKQSQGHVCVESELGKGARFEIYLPRVHERVLPRQPRPISHPPPGSRETVLVVEDEELVRVAARRILEQHGYRVLEAGSGREALRLCEEHLQPIRLLITDIVMPEMNGRELARQITSQRPNMKVIFVSGYADSDVIQQDVEASYAGYMQKPFSPETLLRAVRERLGP